MLWRIDRLDTPSAIGLALIFGGAMGNVFDRVRAGSVTDFLDFYTGSYHWYTFNVADASICTGAGLLILSMFCSHIAAARFARLTCFRDLIQIGSFSLPTYGVLVALAFLVALCAGIALREAARPEQREGRQPRRLLRAGGDAGREAADDRARSRISHASGRNLFAGHAAERGNLFRRVHSGARFRVFSICGRRVCRCSRPRTFSLPASPSGMASGGSDVSPPGAAGANRRICPGPSPSRIRMRPRECRSDSAASDAALRGVRGRNHLPDPDRAVATARIATARSSDSTRCFTGAFVSGSSSCGNTMLRIRLAAVHAEQWISLVVAGAGGLSDRPPCPRISRDRSRHELTCRDSNAPLPFRCSGECFSAMQLSVRAMRSSCVGTTQTGIVE